MAAVDDVVLQMVRQHMRDVKEPGHYDKVFKVGATDLDIEGMRSRAERYKYCSWPSTCPLLVMEKFGTSSFEALLWPPPLLEGRVHVLLCHPRDAWRPLHQPHHPPGK